MENRIYELKNIYTRAEKQFSAFLETNNFKLSDETSASSPCRHELRSHFELL